MARLIEWSIYGPCLGADLAHNADIVRRLRQLRDTLIREGRTARDGEPDMNQGAQRYLVERLMIAQDRPQQTEVVQWRQQMLAGFGGAIEALRAAEAMDSDEVHDWNNRMHVALGLEPLEPLPPGFTGGRAVFIGEGERPTRPPAPPIARFLGLIPVLDGDREVPYGGRLQILGIERYDSKAAVTWRMAPLPDAESKYAEELRAHDHDTEGLPDQERKMLRRRFQMQLNHPAGDALTLSDDLGTEYLKTGGGASGGGNEQTGRAQFMPAVPEGAAELTIRWDELVFRVQIGGPNEAK